MTQVSLAAEHDHSIWLKGLIQELRVRNARLLNRRCALRYQLNVPVALCARSESGRIVHVCQAWAQDLSEVGVGLLTVCRFNINDEAFVNFEPASGRLRHLPLRIVHCRRLFGPVFKVGAEFAFGAESDFQANDHAAK
ncbi:MAG: hypothetical protein V3T53_00545 [Phycisphaerales bacterium]